MQAPCSAEGPPAGDFPLSGKARRTGRSAAAPATRTPAPTRWERRKPPAKLCSRWCARHRREAAITESYAGSWIITRSIFDDDDTAATIACAGTATLRPHDGALLYHEAVTYELRGKLIRATRTYRFASTGGSIAATFDDGRPFFTLQLDGDGTGRAHHQCGADGYELTLTLRHADRWQTCWDVSGTKRLRIVTDYVRLEPRADSRL